MSTQDREPQTADGIGGLYPELDPDQLRCAEENLERYLVLAMRIFARLHEDAGQETATPVPENALTSAKTEPTMGTQRSNPT